MVLITLVRDYIDRMLHDIPGMKVLVLDPQTVRAPSPGRPQLRLAARSSPIFDLTRSVPSQVGMVSVVYSQSDLLRKEVFLVETMDNASSSRESMAHLKAVYFLRPSANNVQKLRRQLAMPRFAEYHLCASLVTELLWNFCSLELIDLVLIFLLMVYAFAVFSSILKVPQIQILADSDEQSIQYIYLLE